MAKSSAVDRPYESLFICPSDTPQKTIDNFIEKIKTAITPSKGVLRGVQIWGRRRLTYPIKHHRDGLFVFLDFTGEGKTPEALKNLFRVNDFVLRHMITDKVVLNPPPVRKLPTTESGEAAAATGATPAAPASPESQSKEIPSKESPSKEFPSA